MTLAAAAPFVKWRCSLDETSGNRADSVNGHTAVQNGTVTSTTGKLGNAAVFPYTTSDFLEVADHADIRSGDNDWMVCVWVYVVANFGDYPLLMHKGRDAGVGADDEWVLFIDGGIQKPTLKVRSPDTSATSAVNVTATAMSVNTWYLVCGWHKATANLLGCSTNGVGDEQSYSAGVNSGTGVMRLGYSSGEGLKFNGYLDESLFMRGYVLDSTEQAALYNSGTGVTFPNWTPAAAPSPPVSVVRRQAVRRASRY